MMKRPTMGDMNVWYCGYAATIPAMAGSWLTFFFYTAAIWAVINTTYRRYTLEVPRRSMPLILSGLALCAVMTVSGLLNGPGWGLVNAMASLCAFLAAPLLIARIRNAEPERSWLMFLRYAPLGALGGVAMSLITGTRHGGAGNENVFAAAMGVLAIFSLANTFSPRRLVGLLGAGGFALAAAGIFMSNYRTLYPFIVLLPLLLLVFGLGRTARSVLVALGLMAVAAWATFETIEKQIWVIGWELENLGGDGPATAMSARLDLWQAATKAFQESPVIGHGMLHKMTVVRSHLSADLLPMFTHTHNAFLDAAVAGGVLGLLAMIAVVVSPLWMVFGRTGERRDRRFVVVSMTLMFVAIGMTSVFYTHDLLVVLFVFPLVVAAACDPAPDVVRLLTGRNEAQPAPLA